MRVTERRSVLSLHLLLLASLWARGVAAAEATKPRKIAVLNVMPRVGIEAGQVELFAVLIQSELRGRRHEVIGKADIETLLGLEKAKDVLGCDKSTCIVELGGSLGVDEILTGDVARIGTALVVSLRRLDARNAKVIKDSVRRVDGAPDKELLEFIGPLVDDLYGLVERPRPAASSGTWQAPAGGTEVIVSFESQPPGAVVIVDEQLRCQRTPCSVKVAVGQHVVSMHLERYEDRRNSVTIGAVDQTVTWRLGEQFGWLTLTANTTGEPVMLNNATALRPPVKKHELAPGNYELAVRSKCFQDQVQQVVIRKGNETQVDWQFRPRLGGLRVVASDETGNDVRASVRIDGKDYGDTLSAITVPVCARAIEVTKDGYVPWIRSLSLEEQKVANLQVRLERLSEANTRSSRNLPAVDFRDEDEKRQRRNATVSKVLWGVGIPLGILAVTLAVVLPLTLPPANRLGVAQF
ncbi:MAG: PEGA domain-containing protein [Deltaproteobacteria bacterium]|nr:PEGA domain-containing protein [Deltaproteobacteria bacterium]